jgi:hypothetical protein
MKACLNNYKNGPNSEFTIGGITGKDRESDFVAAGASAIVRDLIAESGMYDILDGTRK